jgi:predicted amidohydrolase
MKSVDNDLQVNADKIVVYINQLKEQDVDLILFPELTLAGDAADASTYRLKSRECRLLRRGRRQAIHLAGFLE